MLRLVKQYLFQPWRLMFLFRKRPQRSIKLKVLRIFASTVAFGAFITTLSFTGVHIKSFTHLQSSMDPKGSSDRAVRSLKDSTLQSTSSREPTFPLPTMFPGLALFFRSLPIANPGLYENLGEAEEDTPDPPALYRDCDCKSWKKHPQHKTTLITRTVCVRPYTLLILVSSATRNIERRNLIRLTWGRDKRKVPQWKTYFLIGQSRNQTQSDNVKAEQDVFADIIRADYYEHYWNQSLKIQMAFEWAARYCNFSFLLKADDDVFVNAKSLIDFLQLPSTPKERLYIGKLHKHPTVRREGKWKVSDEEYKHNHYPDFCSGAGFVMTYDVIECVVALFDVIKPYRMDDVYVGMLAHGLGVEAKNHSGFVMPWDGDYDSCDFVPNTLVQHRATGACLMELYSVHSLRTKNATAFARYMRNKRRLIQSPRKPAKRRLILIEAIGQVRKTRRY